MQKREYARIHFARTESPASQMGASCYPIKSSRPAWPTASYCMIAPESNGTVRLPPHTSGAGGGPGPAIAGALAGERAAWPGTTSMAAASRSALALVSNLGDPSSIDQSGEVLRATTSINVGNRDAVITGHCARDDSSPMMSALLPAKGCYSISLGGSFRRPRSTPYAARRSCSKQTLSAGAAAARAVSDTKRRPSGAGHRTARARG